MTLSDLPFWTFPLGTFALILIGLELGYRLGIAAHKRFSDEKESSVSAIAGLILGLLAFILAITFGMVSERYDKRKELVREEANAIRTAYFRADFLPDADRETAKALYRDYLHTRIEGVKFADQAEIKDIFAHSHRVQRELWDMAVANARKDMNSDVAALYIESVNDVINVHAERIAIGWHTRVPAAMWLALFSLVIFGVGSVGYQMAIGESRRSLASFVLALAFTIVFTMIFALDNTGARILTVSQQPLEDVRALIGT